MIKESKIYLYLIVLFLNRFFIILKVFLESSYAKSMFAKISFIKSLDVANAIFKLKQFFFGIYIEKKQVSESINLGKTMYI